MAKVTSGGITPTPHTSHVNRDHEQTTVSESLSKVTPTLEDPDADYNIHSQLGAYPHEPN